MTFDEEEQARNMGYPCYFVIDVALAVSCYTDFVYYLRFVKIIEERRCGASCQLFVYELHGGLLQGP